MFFWEIDDKENEEMTYGELVKLLNKLYEENQLLKQALRESLEQYGNSCSIDVLDELFDLQYDDWRNKRNETETYDYVDWEEILEQKEMME